MKNTIKHNGVVRFNHWFSALIIMWATLSGLYISEVSSNIQLNETISYINVSLTTILIPFFIFRFVYKYFFSPELSLDNSISGHIATWVHRIMYVLISAVLISGILMMNHHINVFNFFVIPQIVHDASLNHNIEIFHKYTCRLLAVFIALHLLAVIKHELLGTRILKRMI